MKAIIQRVSKASVEINGEEHSQIERGFVVMLGIAKGDTIADCDFIIDKLLKLRLFENEESKFDLDLKEIKGEILIISQFTLFADISKGRRPFFGNAEEPKKARKIYEEFLKRIRTKYKSQRIKSGEFAALMKVKLVNNGPVTLIFNSNEKK